MARRLQAVVNESIARALSDLREEETREDVLLTFQRQVNLLLAEERTKSAIVSDPFLHFQDSKEVLLRFVESLKVTDHHSLTTLDSYTWTTATVQLPTSSRQSTMELSFKYERQGLSTTSDAPTATYSIHLSDNIASQRQQLLWVQVWATSGGKPAAGKAVNIADEDDLWSDVDDQDMAKEADVQGENPRTGPDHFAAGIDPDLLRQFLDAIGLSSIDDLSAAFLLLSFPFYEMEWDLVGYLLDAVFGPDDDEMDEASS